MFSYFLGTSCVHNRCGPLGLFWHTFHQNSWSHFVCITLKLIYRIWRIIWRPKEGLIFNRMFHEYMLTRKYIFGANLIKIGLVAWFGGYGHTDRYIDIFQIPLFWVQGIQNGYFQRKSKSGFVHAHYNFSLLCIILYMIK